MQFYAFTFGEIGTQLKRFFFFVVVFSFIQLTSDQLADVYKDFVKNYPVVSIEDPFDQDDWEAYTKMTADTNIQIVG